ncbi:RnfABCDGE type electron transport complex subunit D [bacterium]|nr:RnfABCDGE type electron transport complex subunit D [bacterium]
MENKEQAMKDKETKDSSFKNINDIADSSIDNNFNNDTAEDDVKNQSPDRLNKSRLNNKEVLLMSHSPHIWSGFSTSKIMYIFLASLIFPAASAVYFFGLRALWIIITSTATAVLTEFIIKKARKKKFVMDGSAIITGLLLALTLPPRIPIWMVAVGSAFSIAIAKEAFGGIGYNIFNPALAGRAFLAICFPVEMTSWYLPGSFGADAVTSATPLSESFVYEGSKAALYKNMFFGNIGGSIGETSALLLVLAFIFLVIFKIIDWKVPLIFMATVAIFSLIGGDDVLFQMLAGGLIFGAVFMATDYVTTPVTGPGRAIFALGCGLITFVIRKFGAMPEGVCFSILIMNGFTPLIDRYVWPKPFGFVREKVKVKAKG